MNLNTAIHFCTCWSLSKIIPCRAYPDLVPLLSITTCWIAPLECLINTPNLAWLPTLNLLRPQKPSSWQLTLNPSFQLILPFPSYPTHLIWSANFVSLTLKSTHDWTASYHFTATHLIQATTSSPLALCCSLLTCSPWFWPCSLAPSLVCIPQPPQKRLCKILSLCPSLTHPYSAMLPPPHLLCSRQTSFFAVQPARHTPLFQGLSHLFFPKFLYGSLPHLLRSSFKSVFLWSLHN